MRELVAGFERHVRTTRVSAAGGAAVEDASYLGEGVEAALVDTVAELLQLLPSFRRSEIFGPERKRSALAGSRGVDGAPLLPKDAVAVRLETQDALAGFVFCQKPFPERSHPQPEETGDALDLARAHVDPPGLRAPATVVALMARETKPRRVPRL